MLCVLPCYGSRGLGNSDLYRIELG
jgi:hypothetical protein